MSNIIIILLSICIIFALITCYLILHISDDKITSFSSFNRLFDSWSKQPILDIKIREFDDCFSNKYSSVMRYEWPGSKNGCDCYHIRNQLLYQKYFKKYRLQTYDSPCNDYQHKLECVNVTSTQKKILRKWRNKHFCSKKLPTNPNFNKFNLTYFNHVICPPFSIQKVREEIKSKLNEDSNLNIFEKLNAESNYYMFNSKTGKIFGKEYIFENDSDSSHLNICTNPESEGYKPCGILDTLGQILYVSIKENCPKSDYHFMVSSNFTFSDYEEKIRKIRRKYEDEYERTHEKYTLKEEAFDNFTLKFNNIYEGVFIDNNDIDSRNLLLNEKIWGVLVNKPHYHRKDHKHIFKNLNNNEELKRLRLRIPIDFKIVENNTICFDGNEEKRKEIDHSLLVKIDKLNYCKSKPNVNKISSENVNHINNNYLLLIEDLFNKAQEDVINRFNIIDTYNKLYFYIQNEVNENFMLAKNYPPLHYTNITLFDEVYIGWKSYCREFVYQYFSKSKGDILTKNYRNSNFEINFNNDMKEIEFLKSFFTILFFIKLFVFLWNVYFLNSMNYANFQKKFKIIYLIWTLCLLLVCEISYYKMSENIINVYSNYDSELEFLKESITNYCSDEYTNLSLNSLFNEILHNLKIFTSLKAIITLSISIILLMLYIEIYNVIKEKPNIIYEAHRKLSEETLNSRKKLSPVHVSKFISYSDTSESDKNSKRKSNKALIKINSYTKVSLNLLRMKIQKNIGTN